MIQVKNVLIEKFWQYNVMSFYMKIIIIVLLLKKK